MAYSTLFDAATEAALAGSTVLTANERATRLLRRECDRRMSQTQKSWNTPRILTWNTWLSSWWRECILRGLTERVLLTSNQELAVWTDILEVEFDSLRAQRLAPLLMESRQLAKQFGMEITPTAFAATAETRAFAEWNKRFQRQCQQNGWIDSAELASALPEFVAATRDWLPPRAVLYGFDDLTPQQRNLIVSCDATDFTVLNLNVGKHLRHARAIPFADSEQEIRTAALWARNKIETNANARIGIIVPQLVEMHATVEHIFREVLNPETLAIENVDGPLAFDVAVGPALSDYPLVRTALTALQLSTGAVKTLDAELLIRSRYLSGSQQELSARAMLDLAVRASARFEVSVGEVLTLAHDRRCSDLAARLEQFLSKAAKSPTVSRRELTQRFSTLLDALGWPGDEALSSEDFQVREKWVELLAEFAALDAVSRVASVRDAVDELAKLAERQQFRVESAGAPVQILGTLEAAGSIFDHIWMLGLTDDAWPARGRPSSFIPLSIQRACKMPHSSAAADMHFAAAVLDRIASSAAEVVLSWPQREDDRELRASPLISAVTRLSAKDLHANESPAWFAAIAPGTELFSDERAPAPPPGHIARGGTYLFELQSRCPFRAFAEFRLKAADMDTAAMGIDPRERGRLVETVLDYIWRELKDHFTLVNTIRSADFETIVTRCIDRAFDDVLDAPRDNFDIRFRELERERLKRLVREWLELECNRAPFTVLAHQQPVDITIADLTLRGRIDRLDRLDDGSLTILDYKTGSDSLGPGAWEGERPDKPQLPLYAVAQNEGSVSAVAFARVRTQECKLAGIATRPADLGLNSRAQRDVTAEIENWRRVLKSLAQEYREGRAAADPKDDRICANCHLPSLCRVAETDSPLEVADDA